MTPARARLTLMAIMALFLATAGNALFLQERSRAPASMWASRVPQDKPHLTSTTFEAASVPVLPAATQPPAVSEPKIPHSTQLPVESAAQRLVTALQRELGRRGYADQLQAQANGLRLAVLAYEFDNSMPLTGEPTEALLKQILFDINQAPRGAFADRAEANQRLVLEIQKALLGHGFFRGALSGRMDIWTSEAVKDFERHQGLTLTGRLTEATLLELVSFSGQPLLLTAN
ncbi:MAG: peptidoglycan-binding domain-containing protein [Rhodomicrobium sp.]